MAVNLEELKKCTVDDLVAKIVDFDTKLSEATKPVTEAQPSPAAAPASEKTLSEKPSSESPAQNIQLSEAEKKLSESNKKLSEELAATKRKLFESEIEKKFSDLAAKGVPPVVIEKAKFIALAENGAQTVKLSEKNEKNEMVEKTVSFSDALVDLLASVPTVKLGEQTTESSPAAGSAEPTADQRAQIETVKKYAEENKKPFRVALSECITKGLVKAPAYKTPE
jgi:hypothetical protein